MSRVEDIFSLVDRVYEVLSPEELFHRAKVYSWQTFFHHSMSVALVSYRLGELIKKNLRHTVDKLAMSSMESKLGISYEILLFYVGLAHDYVKLRGVSSETGERRIKEILTSLIKGDPNVPSSVDVESLIEKVVKLAMAVEGGYEPTLEEELVRYVAPVVRVADWLVGKWSLDEAIRLFVLDEFRRLSEDFGLRIGYVKVSVPSVLYAKISERVVEALREHGWTPIVVYADGLIVVGDSDSRPMPLSEVSRVLEQEILSVFEARRRIEDIVNRLSKKPLAEIFSYLEQTRASSKLEIDLSESAREEKKKREISTIAYHNLIVSYLAKRDPRVLAKELEELRRQLKRQLKVNKLFDPRALATGLYGKGSTYFVDVLKTMVTTPDELAEIAVSIGGKREKFLLLSYAMAFASEDVEVIRDVLAKLGIALGEGDAELVRIVAIAEAYSRLSRDEDVRKAIKAVVGRLGLFDVKPYIRRLLARIRSNVIDAEGMKLHEGLKVGHKSYCRICGEPVEPVIRYIEYAKGLRGVGGASEIWLHDDPPLADLEKISEGLRHICPVCYYESRQVERGYRPPFLVLALHPVVSYDLWRYVLNRATMLSDIWSLLQMNPRDVASIYGAVVRSLKLTDQDVRKLEKVLEGGKGGPTVIFDNLGARVLLPLGGEASMRRRDSALALALAPLAIALAGGGQVGLVSTLADAYNLGVEPYPVALPHPSPLVEEVVTTFEKIKVERMKAGGELSQNDYPVYGKSYVTLLRALLLYGLKVFAWYSGWRSRRRGSTRCEDYALALHEFMASVPHAPLSLASPAPESLYPTSDERPIPFYNLIFHVSSEVEKSMSEPQKLLGEKAQPKIVGAISLYAKLLKELSVKLGTNLTRHDVQAPLRKAIDVMLDYLPAIGEDNAVRLAVDTLIHTLEVRLAANLGEITRTTKDGREESYREAFAKVFKAMARAVLKIHREYPASKCMKFVEVVLDSAYERYRHLKIG